MSSPAAPVFIGIAVAIYLVAKYWRVAIVLLVAGIITALFLGAQELAAMVQDQADPPGAVVEGEVRQPAVAPKG